MSQTNESNPKIPPEIARYIAGPQTESNQFNFLLGDWDVVAERLSPDGSPALQYKAEWTAKTLNDGRMIMDDFRALSPSGVPISSFVTLRTYSETTARWEIAGLGAFQPSGISEWHGVFRDGEMILDAKGFSPDGVKIWTKIRFFEIQADSFKWESSISKDEGANWFNVARLQATRKQL